MSSVKRFSVLLLLIGTTAACQPLPQPFQADPRTKATSTLIRPLGESSLFVPPVDGLPKGADAAMAEALAKALVEREVPASATERSRLSTLLTVTLEPRGNDAIWRWSERLSDGSRQDSESRPLGLAAARLAGGDEGAVKQAAASMAAIIAAHLNETTIAMAPVDDRPPKLAVQECEGAPGDGNRSLRQAMREILILGGQTPLAEAAGADFVIGCKVQVWSDSPDSERVAIEWVLLGADGSRLGEVKQGNRIPRGQLAKAWGGTAHIIAQGGWQGLSQILETKRRSRTANPPAKS